MRVSDPLSVGQQDSSSSSSSASSSDDEVQVHSGKSTGASAGGLHWSQAGMIMFSFCAAPAIMTMPYLIGMAGYVGGLLMCLVVTAAATGGSMMLLRIKLLHPSCVSFGDLGREVLGRPGKVWGDFVQIGSFCLILPCALVFCALSLQGTFGGCDDYYVFSIALVCLLTTQLRTLGNTMLFCYISVVSIVAMAVCMVVAAFAHDNPEKVPAQMFGNPEADNTLNLVRVAGGFTVAAWAYVPAFLTVELATDLEDPTSFDKSILMSAVLNVMLITVVGFTVVSRWGYAVGEVVVITEGVAVWRPGSPLNDAFNMFQLVGNFAFYMLTSVPLGRFCQKAWSPNFADTWSAPDVLRYLGYTLPTFFLAVLLAVFVPSINTLLDFTTALLMPMVTMIYPAVLYWRLFCRRGAAPSGECQQGGGVVQAATPLERGGVAAVITVGCVTLVFCWIKAVGHVALEELRPMMEIGCGDWTILSTDGAATATSPRRGSYARGEILPSANTTEWVQ